MTRRRAIAALAAAVLLAAGGLCGYWLWAADRLSAAIAQWTQEQRARGYEVAYDGPEIGGFPLALTARFGAPSLAAPQGWRWSGAAVGGEAAVWAPQTLHLTLPRVQTLTGAWNGKARALTLEAAAARGVVRLARDGRMAGASVEMEDLRAADETGRTLSARAARAGLAQRPPGVAGSDDWSLLVTGVAEQVVLPEAEAGPLGAAVEHLDFEATLVGAIPPGAPAEALSRWRDAGGLVRVAGLALDWGPLQVRAKGTAALDQALRPEGAFTARLRGLHETIETLIENGLIESKQALAVRFAVLALATADEDGRPVVTVPVTLRDGRLYLGPVAVLAVGPVL